MTTFVDLPLLTIDQKVAIPNVFDQGL